MNIQNLKVGDVIIEELPRGFYGCMVVLDVGRKNKTFLVMTSKYFSKNYPSLEDSEIMISTFNKSGTRDINY
ncbi:hypothetical protein BUY12_11350, partial [Staphylococcus chromogenes]|uniref:hypothetical protein n=1 Tax=Staphylococcus chromogenes TaxID=46126 RepID=UPI000D4EA5E6